MRSNSFSRMYQGFVAFILLDMWPFSYRSCLLIKVIFFWIFSLNYTVDHFQKYAFLLWLLNTNAFFLSYGKFSQVLLLFACFFSLVTHEFCDLLILHRQPQEVHLLSQGCLSQSQLFSGSYTVSVSILKHLVFSLLNYIHKASCQVPSFNIFCILLLVKMIRVSYAAPLDIWTRHTF